MSQPRALHEVHARTDPRILLPVFLPIGDTLLATPTIEALRNATLLPGSPPWRMRAGCVVGPDAV
jgi:hypothetical protein